MHPWLRRESVLSISFFFAVFSILFFTTPAVHAQTLPGQGLGLLATPEFPTPHSPVEVSLNDYSIDTAGADVSWYVNGVEKVDSRNERTIQVLAGDLGKKTSVRVVLTRSGVAGLSATTSFVPTQVDLILEANTYVPDFYRGRALPSPESSARAIALVHDGTTAPLTAYTYKWSEDGEVLFGGPVKGKSSIDITVSRFKGKTLTVDVSNGDGVAVGRQTLYLEATQPQILFYEHCPLRGLLEKAIVGPLPFIGEEISVYGEPFFLHTNVADSEVDFSWEIDGTPTNVTSESPNAITLRQVGGGGGAEIGLRIVTKKRIPQVIEKAFEVFFE
jgi:hypothetical protein